MTIHLTKYSNIQCCHADDSFMALINGSKQSTRKLNPGRMTYELHV